MASRLTHPKGNFSANYRTGENLLFTSNKMDAPMLASKTGQSGLWDTERSRYSARVTRSSRIAMLLAGSRQLVASEIAHWTKVQRTLSFQTQET